MNEEIKKEIDALKKKIKSLETKIVNNKVRVGADAPTEYKTIQELELATYDIISLNSVLAIENDSGTFKISMQDLIKSISYLQSLTDTDRNLWQDTLPIGSLVHMLSQDYEDGTYSFKNLGNWLPCNGQRIQRVDYPTFFEMWPVINDLTEIALPNLNGFGTSSGDGYFLRGVDPAVRIFGLTMQEDAIQSMNGTLGNMYGEDPTSNNPLLTISDKTKQITVMTDNSGSISGVHDLYHYNINFNAGAVVNTSAETRPLNMGVGIYVKLDNKY